MKFSCDRCQARYQIPDEKVAGRRLRYTCRKCEYAIVLDGTTIVLDASGLDVSPSSEPLGALAPQSIPPSAMPAPNALLAQPAPKPVAAPATAPKPKPLAAAPIPPARISAPPPRASIPPARVSAPPPRVSVAPTTNATSAIPELPIWHVAIASTPVGPLRKSEVRARAEKGEVTRASLAWREGLDDWKPISEIPELAVVVLGTGSSDVATVVSAPAVTIASDLALASADPSSDGAAELETFASTPTPVTRAQESGSSARPISTPPVEPATPEPARASTARDDHDASEPLVAPRSTGRALPALIAFGVIAVVALALVIGRDDDDGGPESAVTTAATRPNPATRVDAGAARESTNDSLAVEDIGNDSELAAYAGLADSGAGRAAATERTVAAPTERTAAVDDRALPMPVAQARTTGTESTDAFETRAATSRPSAATGPLDAAQISAVVRANRSRAQRCYERAATMSGSAPDMRLSVTVRIATSGDVSNVDITGNDFGGVIACVERIVNTWRFPASTTGGQSTFSLVFAGG